MLIIREAGVRSTLVAHLSYVGAELITARSIDDPVLARNVRRPSVLIIDQPLPGIEEEMWLVPILDDPRWLRVVMLCEEERPPSPDPRLIHCHYPSAPKSIAEQVPAWRALVNT